MLKHTSMQAALLLSLAPLGGVRAESVKMGSDVIKTINVEDLLAQSLKVDRSPRSAEDSGCPGGSGGGGFKAKRYCTYRRGFDNLEIEEIKSVKIGEINLSQIPSSYKFEYISFENCWKDRKYPFNQDVTYRSNQSAQVTMSEILTSVKDYSGSIDLNPAVLDQIGIKISEKTGRSVSYQLTNGTTKSLSEDFELKTHIEYDIPPFTSSWASYSDEKKSVRLPVTITGVIKGRIVDFVYNQALEIQRLSDLPKDKRTFEVNGFIDFLGSNRSLTVKTGEKTLSPDYCSSTAPPSLQR